MSEDRYVIVCRDGYTSRPLKKDVADILQACWNRDETGDARPAYRIRIREKAKPERKLGVYSLPDGRVECVYRPDPFNNLPQKGYVFR